MSRLNERKISKKSAGYFDSLFRSLNTRQKIDTWFTLNSFNSSQVWYFEYVCYVGQSR